MQRFQPNELQHEGNGQQPSYGNQGYNHGTKRNQRLNRDDRNLNFGHNKNQVRGQAQPGQPHQPNSQDARYVDVNSMDPMDNSDPILQNTLVVLYEHEPMVSSTLLMGLEKETVDAAIMTRTQRLGNPLQTIWRSPLLPWMDHQT